MKSAVIYLALAAAAIAHGEPSVPEAWTNAPLGICVSECTWDAYGVDVRFETDLQPPYLVGVYRMEEIGLARYYPVAEVQTNWKHARVTVPLLDVTLFVQVMTVPSCEPRTNIVVRRELTQEEFDGYRSKIKNAKVESNIDPNTSWEYNANDSNGELISDHSWLKFIKTDEVNPVFSFSYRTTTVERVVIPLRNKWCHQDIATYVFNGPVPSTWKFNAASNWESRKSSTYTSQAASTYFSDDVSIQDEYAYGLSKYFNGQPWYLTHSRTDQTTGATTLSYEKLYDGWIDIGKKYYHCESATYIFDGSIPSGWSFIPSDETWANRKSGACTNQTLVSYFMDDTVLRSDGIYDEIERSGDVNVYTIETNQWTSYSYGQKTQVTCAKMYDRFSVPYHAVTNNIYGRSEPITRSFCLTNADVSVGSGYRIVIFEDNDIVIAQRAYSSRTNMSDEVVIERGWKAISTHNGFRYTKDWLGRSYFQADTNNAPDIIHFNGIR